MKVVFTNGCFDVLHAGHLALLKKAKSWGDKLVVGLDSDKSVLALKGRLVHDQKFRKQLLESIRWVDQVIIFNNLLRLIKRVKPDIIVKGGDYTRDTIVGASFVESHGGEVKVFPRIKGYSTTDLIQRIKQIQKS